MGDDDHAARITTTTTNSGNSSTATYEMQCNEGEMNFDRRIYDTTQFANHHDVMSKYIFLLPPSIFVNIILACAVYVFQHDLIL